VSELLLTAYDGSILGPIAKILGWLMNGIYELMAAIGIENVGLAIIVFTIVIYMLMFPMTYKQQKFSKLSQKMQPELNAIRKKYENKKDQASMMAMNEETQRVYEKYGVSMTGSCGQMLIQMPILFALYRVFMNVPAYVTGVKEHFLPLAEGIMSTNGFAEKMTQLVADNKIYTQPAVDFTQTDANVLTNYTIDVLAKLGTNGWNSLSEIFPSLESNIAATYDKVSHINALGPLNISDTPWVIIKDSFAAGAILVAFCALLVPVTSYLFQVLNIKMMPTSNNENQNDQMSQQMNMMNKTMPLMSLFMCFSVPVGLGIYWVMSSVVRLVQQYFLNKHFEKINLDDIIKKNQEKAKAKREKMGIAENQIRNAAQINTRRTMSDKANASTFAEKEMLLEKANAAKANAKPGSMAAKANMVKEYNERNSRK